MPVIFSKSCEYAIQAVLYIAKRADTRPIHLKEMATALNIPLHFLSKILQTLVRYEVIQSYKGQNGGFVLARPATEIILNDIVLAIDGTAFLTHCVLGFPGCQDEHPCPVHEEWKAAKEVIHSMVTERTINDLGKDIHNKIHLLDFLAHKEKQFIENIPSPHQE